MSRISGRLLLFVLCALGAGTEAIGGAGVFRVDPDLTRARFAVLELGFSRQEGRLGPASGTIVFDAMQQIERVDLEIEMASVATGSGLRDAFLRSEAMFDAGRFPKLHFHSTGLHYDGTRLKDIEGVVTLRGVTRPLRLAVTRLECRSRPGDGRETCGAEVSGHLSRAAFGMSFGYPLIGDDVELEIIVNVFRVHDADEIRRP